MIVNVSDFNAIQTDYIYVTQVLENASEVTNKFFREQPYGILSSILKVEYLLNRHSILKSMLGKRAWV